MSTGMTYIGSVIKSWNMQRVAKKRDPILKRKKKNTKANDANARIESVTKTERKSELKISPANATRK